MGKELRNWLCLAVSVSAITLSSTVSLAADASPDPNAFKLQVGDDVATLPHALSPEGRKALTALIYGYPYVFFDTIRGIFTNVEAPSADPNLLFAPVNQFMHAPREQTRMNEQGVAPNSDTLYSSAFIDVGKEPVVWHVPAWAGHYYVCPLHNMIADNISIGTRTNADQAVDYVITGPHWWGQLPAGLRRVQTDSDHLWTVCRIRQDWSKASLDSAHAFQHGMSLVPLSQWKSGHRYVPPRGSIDLAITPDMHKRISVAVEEHGPVEFLSRLAMLFTVETPTPDDRDMVALLREFGVVEGQKFDFAALSPEKQAALNEAWPLLRPLLHTAMLTPAGQGLVVDGWPFAIHVGRYHRHYLARAGAAEIGLSGNMKEDNMQSLNPVDSDGQPLNGDNSYVIHFPPGDTPKVEGFWSFTTYDRKTSDIALPPGRHPICNHDATNPLHYNDDGSLDIYLQSNPTGDALKDHNWLPIPAGKPFFVYFRTYGPHPDVYTLNSATGLPAYVLPPLQRQSKAQ
jgi:hypothetical protein